MRTPRWASKATTSASGWRSSQDSSLVAAGGGDAGGDGWSPMSLASEDGGKKKGVEEAVVAAAAVGGAEEEEEEDEESRLAVSCVIQCASAAEEMRSGDDGAAEAAVSAELLSDVSKGINGDAVSMLEGGWGWAPEEGGDTGPSGATQYAADSNGSAAGPSRCMYAAGVQETGGASVARGDSTISAAGSAARRGGGADMRARRASSCENTATCICSASTRPELVCAATLIRAASSCTSSSSLNAC